MKMSKLCFPLISLLGFSLFSCVDDRYDLGNISDDIYLPIEQVFPVGSSEVNVGDLLRELDLEGLHEEADGLIYFQYDTISSFDVNSLEFELDKDTSCLYMSEIFPVVQGLGTGFGISLPELFDIDVKQEIPIVAKLPITFSDETGEGRIDSADIRRVSVDFQIVTNIPGLLDVLDLNVSMPENLKLSHTRSPFTWDKKLAKAELLLEDVWLDLTESDTLLFDCLLKIDGKLPLSQIDENSYIGVVTSANAINYKRLYGFFVAHTVQADTSSMGIDIYTEENIDYSLSLVDPRLEIKAWTNSGVPINVGVESLVARTNAGKSEVAKFGNGSSRYVLTMVPATKEGEEVLGMHEVFNRTNGGIDRLVNISPDTIDVATSFFVNGKEGSAKKSYFLLDSTYIRLGVTTVVPIWMNAGSFITMRDTIKDIDIYQDVVDYEEEDYEIEEATIYLEVENGLPLKAEVDFSFIREDTIKNYEDGRLIEKLLLSEIKNERLKQNVKLEPAKLDEETHLALKPVANLVKIVADKSMLEDIKKIRHIGVQYKVEVPVASASVKVYSQNLIKAKAYVHVKGNYSTGSDK